MKKNKTRLAKRDILIKSAVFSTFVLSLIFASCSIKEPAAPNWDVTVALPLMNRSIPMSEIVEDSDLFSAGDNGLINVDFEEEFEKYEVGDQLKVADLNESFSSQLGDFRVPSPGLQATALNFGDLYPAANILDGQSAPVGAFSYQSPPVALPSFSTIRSVLVETGQIELTVVNRLPVPIAPGLSVEVIKASNDEQIFVFQFPSTIDVDASAKATTSLAGINIPSDLKVIINGSSPGSNGQTVTIDAANDGIDVEALISDLVAISAEAVVDPLLFTGADSLVLGDSIIVRSSSIASGLFSIEVANDIDLGLDLDLFLQDFYDGQDNPVQLTIPISGNQTTVQEVDLSSYSFRPAENQQGSVTHFNWVARMPGSNGQIVTVNSDDAVDIDVNLTNFIFSEVLGIIDNINVKLDTREENIDLPDGLDSLQFEAGRLELIINNGIGFKIFPNITVTGLNESTGRYSEVLISQQIDAAEGSPVPTSIVLDKSNSNIVDLINIFPNKIQVSGNVRIGDGQVESVIRSTDFIESVVHITAPLSLSFPAQTVKTDVDTLDIDADAQSELQNNVLAGKLYARVGNRIPFGLEVSMRFSSQDTSVYTAPELVIGPLALNAAGVSDGRADTEVVSEIEIELTQEEIQLFANDQIFLGLQVSLPSSNNELVRIYGDDYLNIKAYAEFKYHVDPSNE